MIDAQDSSKKDLAGFYDRSARDYQQANYANEGYSPLRYRQHYIETMIESVVPQRGTVLDVGCGPGELLLALAQSGHQVWGVDISSAMVEMASRLLESNGHPAADRVLVGDMESLPFAEGFFDVIVAAGVIEYQNSDAASLDEMWRRLRPNGHLVLNVTNRYAYVGLLDNAYRWLKKRHIPRAMLSFAKSRVLRRGPLRDYPDRRTHWPRGFDRQLAKHGFEKVSHRFFSFSPLPSPLGSALCRICDPVSEKMERLSCHPIASVLAGGYLVMARKAG